MRKKLPCIIWILFASWAFSFPSHALDYSISINKTHGLYNFIETISGFSHRSKTLKSIWDQSHHAKDAQNQKHLTTFIQIHASLKTFSYNFPNLPEARNNGMSVENYFLVASGKSDSIDDFSDRIATLIPVQIHAKLIEILKHFMPIYEDLIWNKSLQKLKNYKNKLNRTAKQAQLSKMFDQAVLFYNAQWPQNLAIDIVLYPIPAKLGFSSAESIGNFESVSVMVDNDNFAERFGIIFHEICHSLFETQALETQQNIEDYYNNNNSLYAKHAYFWLNEALATALGNGWAYHQVKQELDSAGWYHNPYIEGFARQLYPKIIEYLNAKKNIDEDFLEHSIESFAQKFPNAHLDLNNSLRSTMLAGDEHYFKARELKNILYQHFYIQNMFTSSPIWAPESMVDFPIGRDLSLLIVVHPGMIANLEPLLPFYPSLSKHFDSLNHLNNTRTIFSSFENNGQTLVILIAENQDELTDALQYLKDHPHINPTNAIIHY